MTKPASKGFFSRRWLGEVPLAVLFWRDMIGVGSVINLAASILALIVAASGAPIGVAVALHFAPLPYNLFLYAAVSRISRESPLTRLAALAWLIVATLA